MIETHKKLEKGIMVDPGTLNVLVLGRIVNILCQSEALEETEERVKILEQEIPTNKVNMEYLESRVIKQNDLIEDMDQKYSRLDNNGVLVKESSYCENLRKKVVGIEIDMDAQKKSSLKRKEHKKPSQNLKLHEKKCMECGKTGWLA
jgi:uncharacterized protein YoxC